MTSLVQWFNKSSEYEIDGIVGTSEKPWFKADDVCKALGYKSTAMAIQQHIKARDKSSLNDLVDGSSLSGSNSSRQRRTTTVHYEKRLRNLDIEMQKVAR
jgi:prophage antirepressor-like protein